jgi:DNA repair and recombination protein RAD54 and RAD54-like protein
VFCALSPFQLDLYRLLVESPEVRACIRASGTNPLVAINLFQKLCNHPDLLDLTSTEIPGIDKILPQGFLSLSLDAIVRS